MTSDVLDDAIHQAVREGRDVEITEWDGYGYAVEIEGETVLGGLAHESLSIPVDVLDLDADAAALVDGLLDRYEQEGRRRRRERERERTEAHRAAHGADLPPREGPA